ncbi:MAG TPA: acetyl-CoA carboxylase biotin carboxyl carrier protein [Rhizomicrobium sp.]|jgi:acetyl-CoA carboxylase biotin carboxyl carrier protein|nr:acetyl-CoA carboxylase biotin carboxyl carrier protein [Rhizomicrobium sp.]
MSDKSDLKTRLSGNKPGIDAEAIRALSDLLAETGLTEIEVEQNGARIRVARAGAIAALASHPVAAPPVAPQAATLAPAAGPQAGAVTSPMVGTVYTAPEPGRPPFVKVGQEIKEGETLFIVEAMKTMNPIPAPRGGTVKEICVENGTPVEFGQTLLILG